MAHETGSAADPVDLLDKLRLFCVAQGMTIDEYIAFGTSPGQLLSVSFNGGFYAIYFNATGGASSEGIYLSQATDFTASTNPWDRTDATTNGDCYCDVNRARTIPIYHFTFFTGGVVMVSFFTDTSVWRHFCFGDIEKYGTWTGGSYIQGHAIAQDATIDEPYDNNHRYFGAVRDEFDVAQNNAGWVRVDDGANVRMLALVTGTNVIPATRRMRSNFLNNAAISSNIFQTSPSAPSQASSLTPLKFFVDTALDASSGKYNPVGFLRDVRFCNVQHLDNEQVFDTDWLVFAMGVKKDPDIRDGVENTGFLGLAVRVL